MSNILGFNIVEFYKKFSGGRVGYIRLGNIKKLHLKRFIELCEKYDLKWFSSDADYKHKCQSGSCCGILDENKKLNKYAKLQYTNLYQLAREKGFITLKDALACGENIEWRKKVKIKECMNLNDCRGRNKFDNMTYYDYFLKSWNDLKWSQNPTKAFGGVLEPRGRDKEGNVIYFFNYKKDKL